MFRIRRIYDDILPVNQSAIRDVGEVFRAQFPGAPADDVVCLGERLRNPFQRRFKTILYVAENARGRVSGFAIVLHEPMIGFCYLDYMAAGKAVTGRGVGAALYERVRLECITLDAKGLFFECLPDDADRCQDAATRQQNAARLKFYERYGARPIIGTAYETPVPGDVSDNLPHLMFDDLDRGIVPNREFARQVVEAILERKYSSICPPAYIRAVTDSIVDDPVQLRAFRYIKRASESAPRTALTATRDLIAVTINDKHDIHHIRERGYVESPVRIVTIHEELQRSGITETIAVKEHSMSHILAVHDAELVDYLQHACEATPKGKSVYPYVFPIRNATRPPKELSVRAGYYCIDTFTPINQNAFPAAKRAVDSALSAADALLQGRRVAYALVRPPGHHAERRSFGGFCYFNNAAVAAHYLSRVGKIAILDIDYHHGNGQQDIFYERNDVLTISIHGDPDFAYPYFTGFADERGSGPGDGFNVNFPLPETQDGAQYRDVLGAAIDLVRDFHPSFLVIALGLDPAKGDPTGSWLLTPKDFESNGALLGRLNLPTLVVQEGGYRTKTLGVNARKFFEGFLGTHDQ